MMSLLLLLLLQLDSALGNGLKSNENHICKKPHSNPGWLAGGANVHICQVRAMLALICVLCARFARIGASCSSRGCTCMRVRCVVCACVGVRARLSRNHAVVVASACNMTNTARTVHNAAPSSLTAHSTLPCDIIIHVRGATPSDTPPPSRIPFRIKACVRSHTLTLLLAFKHRRRWAPHDVRTSVQKERIKCENLCVGVHGVCFIVNTNVWDVPRSGGSGRRVSSNPVQIVRVCARVWGFMNVHCTLVSVRVDCTGRCSEDSGKIVLRRLLTLNHSKKKSVFGVDRCSTIC